MSAVVSEFVTFLSPRAEAGLRGSARLDIEGEGSVLLDETGARAGDGAADIVLRASEKVFRAILSGDQNPVTAYMTGKLKVEGNAMRALKVSEILTG